MLGILRSKSPRTLRLEVFRQGKDKYAHQAETNMRGIEAHPTRDCYPTFPSCATLLGLFA